MTCDELENQVRVFCRRISQLPEPQQYIHQSAELLNPEALRSVSWRTYPGIYAFESDGRIVYVGRAAKDALGTRIWDQVRPRPGEWHEIVTRPDTRIALYAFRMEDWFWVASLELYLLQIEKPEYNKRRC